ncbi:hypothetical protein [Aphanothece sacrum]|uniref:Peptidase n=1 Tax=Aphanothece sacrum FPU1 TaxID=1920663 RepID=A0A401IMW2_APHSA|nr:hypothetical protein [Aphanothece sacrum]GBF82568.1 peptidase [Aphanothece sacrum FPU1]GBF84702.1 peptidase [Aphanothece sacrum FPU3]
MTVLLSDVNFLDILVQAVSGNSGFVLDSSEVSQNFTSVGMDLSTELSQLNQNLNALQNKQDSYLFQSEKDLPYVSNDHPFKEDRLISQTTTIGKKSVAGISTSQTPLVFGDTEKGNLNNTDKAFYTRYRDEYWIREISDNQQITLNLESIGFDARVQLVNLNNGAIIGEYQDNTINGQSIGQLTFNTQQGIDYMVRVTSISDSNMTGDYTLTTTLGNLVLGVDDQKITGTLSNTDPDNNLRSGTFYDDYYLSNLTPFTQVNLRLASPGPEFDTYLQVIDAKTGNWVLYNDDNGSDPDWGTNSALAFTTQSGIDYIVRVTSYRNGATGNYSLEVNTSSSTSGGFSTSDDINHPILRSRLVDTYVLSGLTAGQDVNLNLNTNSTSTLTAQVFNRDTGETLVSSNNNSLNFTAAQGIDYGVRLIGIDGVNYNLTSNYGTVFEGSVIQLNQTLSSRIVNTDAIINPFESWWRTPTNSGYDGYYLSSNSLTSGQTVQINATSQDFNTVLYLFNASTGEYITFNNDDISGNTNSGITFMAQAGVDYLMMVTPFNPRGTGNYSINVTSLS